MPDQVSIIIPTLNESQCLQQTLNNLALLDPPPQEILIVDGGSQDNTLEIARQAGISVLVATQAGRSLFELDQIANLFDEQFRDRTISRSHN